MLACLAWSGIALAQPQPILQRPVPVAAAFAAERLAVRFDAVGALLAMPGSGAVPAGRKAGLASEAAAAALEDDWPLLQATLGRTDATLASSLAAALHGIDPAASASGVRQQVTKVSALAQQAVSAVEWSGDEGPVARATLITLLLTGPGGVSESYDDAASSGSPLATATAWAALQRVHTLWASLAGLAPGDQASEVVDALAQLHHALPSAAPSTKPDPGTSNDVDNDGTRVVGALEKVVHASLVPDRDLAALAGTVRKVAAAACAAQGADATQGIAATRFYYTGYLQATASMLVPNQDKAVQDDLDALVQGGGSTVDRCSSLLGGLDHVATALGG